MSIPNSETTFASIKYNNKIYRMFDNPLGGEVKKKFINYMNSINYYSSAPWNTLNYLWEIIDNKLFLKKIFIKTGINGCEWEDITNNIFQKEVFANWVNHEIKLLIKKEPFLFPKRKRKVLILNIKNGLIIKTIKKEEIYTLNGLKRILLNYKSIGIFWIYKNEVFSKTETLQEGIKTDNQIIPSFNYKEAFENIKCKKSELYYFNIDELPRGIVTFDIEKGVFKVFTTKDIINNPIYQYKIIENFDLKDEFVEFEVNK
jgi:hypothetical protein